MRRKRKAARRSSGAASAAAGTAAPSAPGADGGEAKAKAAGKRKRPPPQEESSDDEEEEEEEEKDGGSGDDLEVDFEFFDPCEDDYHSVGDMLKSGLWEFVDLNFAELADGIVGQGNIGTLVKSESDAGGAGSDKENTVCGMLTTLNLRQFAQQGWPKAIGTALLQKAEKHAEAEVVEKLKGYLQAKPGSEVGLLFSERFVNLPPQLVPPLHRALVDDIEWSCNTPECPPQERPFYEFKHFIGVVRCFEAKAPAEGAEPAPPKGKRRRGAAGAAAEPPAPDITVGDLAFQKPEDSFYFRRADFAFSFPLPSSAADKQRAGGSFSSGRGAGRGAERRAVFGISRKALERVAKELAESAAFRPGAEAAGEA